VIGFLLLIAWVLFGVVGIHDMLGSPLFKQWASGGEYVYSTGHVRGVGPRHLREVS
jgi:hypothetical protein